MPGTELPREAHVSAREALESFRNSMGLDKPDPHLVTVEDLQPSFRILGFDQTLSATGMVHLVIRDAEIQVLAKTTLRTTTSQKGFWGTYKRAARLEVLLDELNILRLGDWVPEEIIAEMPSVGGHRTESSLMAGREVMRFAGRLKQSYELGFSLMSMQRARTILGGPEARNSKKAGHEALLRFLPETAGRTWNEHERDAAILALGRLFEIKQAQPVGEES